jgi:UDP-N-acetylmuramoylalanine--D-glutamate ligase
LVLSTIMKKIVILGAGESGVGAALLAKKQGFDVFVSDKSPIKDNYQAELIAAHIPFEGGGHTEGIILAADEIVKSPGIPEKISLLHDARRHKIPIISEIEFASRFTKARIIGITGSNGKTTTTSLIYHIFKADGMDVAVGGNIGKSFARLLAEEPERAFYVLELSSFQLDGIRTFRPFISILLNITPDHLDRYDYKMANYVASKFRITMNQTEDDIFITNKDDLEIKRFRDTNIINPNEWVIGTHFDTDILRGRFDMSKSNLKGPHNYFNASCAIAAAIVCGVSDKNIQHSLETFVNAPHRLEFVANIKGTDYINDSKATNVDSVYWALKAMKKPVILILGGQDKGNDYRSIEKLVREKVKALICMGVDNQKIVAHFTPIVKNIEETHSVADAVQVAAKYTEGGDVVLLSPACASFDLFKNYEDRGEQFKKAVLSLRT